MKAIATTLLTLIAIPMLAFAKGETTSITLSQSGKTLATLDAKAVQEFNFGPGPGNILAGGAPNWQPRSWMVEDWEHPVAEPARQLPRIQATFRITAPQPHDKLRDYVVFYTYDPVTRQGYVYLPGRGESHYDSNINLMIRGDKYDGHWFRATTEWTQQVQAAVGAASK